MSQTENRSGYPDAGDDTVIVSLAELEAWAIARALKICRGRVTEAARKLGIGRSTLYRKVEEYKIDIAAAKPGPSSNRA